MKIENGNIENYIYFVAVDATDLKTRETGLSGFTITRSRDGAAAATYNSDNVTEVSSSLMPGVYKLLVDEDMTMGTQAGGARTSTEEMVLHITHASMAPVTRVIELFDSVWYKERAALTYPAGSFGSQVDANVKSFTADAITAAAIHSGAVTEIQNGLATEAKQDTIDGIVDSILTDTGTTLPTTLATIDLNVDQIEAAVITNAAGSDIAADIIAIKAETASILIDTAVIGAAGAGLTEAGGTGDQLTAIPWNSAWDTEVQSECADALTAYDPPTKGEMDTAHALLATVAKQDTIDGIVDAILVDTGTTLPATLATIDGIADAILVDTGTTLPATLTTIDGIVDSILVDTGTTLPATLATIDGIVDDILVDTGTTLPATLATILADTDELQTDNVPGLIAALNNISTTDVKTQADAALVDINLNHLLKDTADDTDVTNQSIIAQLAATSGNFSGYDKAIDSLQAASENASLIRTTIATRSSQISFTLTAGSADDDAYNQCLAVITDAATAVQIGFARVSDYVGSTKTVTLAADPGFTHAASDKIEIRPFAVSKTETEVAASAALSDINLNHLMKVAAADSDVVDNSVIAQMAASGSTATWSTFVNTDDSLQAIRDRGDGSWTTGAGGSAPTVGQIRTEMETSAGMLFSVDAIADKLNSALEADGAGGWQFTALGVENAPSGTGASASTIADAVWDEAMGDHHTPTTFGGGLQRGTLLYSNTIPTGGVTSQTQFVLEDGTHSTNADSYEDCILVITDAGSRQIVDVRRITSYAPGTRTVTIDSAPDNTVAEGDYLTIIPALPVNKLGNNVITAASLASDAVDEIVDGFAAHRGTATAGDTSEITLVGTASTTANIFRGGIITLVGGTGAGQSRRITGYSIGRVATIEPDWVTTPSTDTEYVITGGGRPVLRSTDQATLDGIQTDLSNGTDGLGALKALIDAVDDYVDGEVAAIKTAVDLIKAQTVDALSEPTGVPDATPTLEEAIMYLYGALRNKLTVTSSAKTFHKDDESALYKKALTDNGTIYTEGEAASP